MNSKTTLSNNMAERLIWVDLEMSDLDITKGQILEMACIITDSELNIVAEGPDLVIHQVI
jgi:oligoribonuclease